ncbi:hypothetical protein OZX72_09230 [Bifidobacterium sp. ESL0769]|uniref:leucine-rich repeat domain-containing protein n=1 Tax=Bifidobacterium sp. ESL0769 TaxID=2983229 RepID=UPI0023F6B60A|nr:leucine-rich repeat domain-containing protein [Bifidobacterium sp. ESL0769]WEV67397.1 hypothetical protein OZX72_09230 [Bifidobacterium sp. ESL0769]
MSAKKLFVSLAAMLAGTALLLSGGGMAIAGEHQSQAPTAQRQSQAAASHGKAAAQPVPLMPRINPSAAQAGHTPAPAPQGGGIAPRSGCIVGSTTISACFPDPVLAQLVASANSTTVGALLTPAMVTNTTSLQAIGSDKMTSTAPRITDLTGLEVLTNLNSLVLHNQSITDVTPLANLNNLTRIDLAHDRSVAGLPSISSIASLSSLPNVSTILMDYNRVSDLSPISSWHSLQVIGMDGNGISSVGFFSTSSFLNLQALYIMDNQISDVSALSTLRTNPNFLHLDLGGNRITNLSPLSVLTQVKFLDVQFNPITDISALAPLTNLLFLSIRADHLTNFSTLSLFTHLTVLDIADCGISDLTPISGLTEMQTLYACDNNISSLALLSGMTQLYELHAGNEWYTNSGGNTCTNLNQLLPFTHLGVLHMENLHTLTDLTPLQSLPTLTELYLTNDGLTNTQLGKLSVLNNLNVLKADRNAQISNLTPLSGLVRLTTLNLDYDNISDISALRPLTAMNSLHLVNNHVADLTPMSGMTNLLSNVETSNVDISGQTWQLDDGHSLHHVRVQTGKLPDGSYAPLDTAAGSVVPASGYTFDAPSGTVTWANIPASMSSVKAGFSAQSVSLGSAAFPYSGKVTRGIGTLTDHEVTFDTDGGSAVPSENLSDGDTFNEPQTTKAGWHVDHWIEVPSGTTYPFTSGVSPAVLRDLNLKVIWARNMHNVTYDPHGVAWTDRPATPAPVAYDLTIANAPSTAGLAVPVNYHLSGWEYQVAGGAWAPFKFGPSASGTHMPDADITVRPVWTRSTHQLTYSNNGGTWPGMPAPGTVNEGDTVAQPASVSGLVAPSHERLSGWEYSVDGTTWHDFEFAGSANPTAVPGSDFTVRPKWVSLSSSVPPSSSASSSSDPSSSPAPNTGSKPASQTLSKTGVGIEPVAIAMIAALVLSVALGFGLMVFRRREE